MDMFEAVENALKGFQRRELVPGNLVRSAVLVPLFLKDGVLHVLLCRRTDFVLKHKRQISFPGGAVDPGDADAVGTALRESFEEVGLAPGHVRVLGLLSDTETITGFLITPVVGIIPYPYPFQASPREVDEMLLVPFDVFSHPTKHRRETFEYEGRTYETDFYHHQEHIIWGATARILRELVELMDGGPRPFTSRSRT
jgi:8-oxo-dGTP pyrophosphatase MutT (NUDIX family)